MLWCYNNAPSVFAFQTQEHADKDKHTHKQMLAGKHGQTGKKIDEQNTDGLRLNTDGKEKYSVRQA